MALSTVPTDGQQECSSTAPLVLLPQDQGDESPACLDGSPYGLYHVRSRSNSTKWTIYLEGGGWCDDEIGCLGRANSSRECTGNGLTACAPPRLDTHTTAEEAHARWFPELSDGLLPVAFHSRQLATLPADARLPLYEHRARWPRP